MTARNRYRRILVGSAVAALLAPLALVAAFASPASAAPGKPHEVYIYKVEKHVDMSGEFPDQYLHDHVFCNPGDIALDGMWRVDHVDQANPPFTQGDERDVYFTASYGDDADRTKWHFRAHNYADGDAQIKLWVTCIRGTVEQAHGHTHSVQVSSRHDDAAHTSLGADVEPVITNSYDHLFQCGPGEIAVAPGFNFTHLGPQISGGDDDDFRVRLAGSWPTATYRGWHWDFLVEDSGVNVTLYLRCLSIKTSAAGAPSHAHNLEWAFRPNGFGGSSQLLSVVGTQERRINCDDGADGKFFQDYKAAVAGFRIHDPWHTWFLGMDPRPKQRAYKFWWDGTSFNDVNLGAICIRARTSKQVAP